jgi:hypothetical protein
MHPQGLSLRCQRQPTTSPPLVHWLAVPCFPPARRTLNPFPVLADSFAASAANSSRPNAGPAIPQPPLRRIAGDLCNDLCRFSDETFLAAPIEGAREEL